MYIYDIHTYIYKSLYIHTHIYIYIYINILKSHIYNMYICIIYIKEREKVPGPVTFLC